MSNAMPVEINEENAGKYVGNPSERLIPLLDNEFVASIWDEKIFYTRDFYVAMYKKIQEGCSYVQAYESLGFPIALLGKVRAEQAGKKAMEKARNNTLFTVDPANYDGSVKLEDMVNLNQEEKIAYLTARTLYLESMVEAQKKIQSILQDSTFSSKFRAKE